MSEVDKNVCDQRAFERFPTTFRNIYIFVECQSIFELIQFQTPDVTLFKHVYATAFKCDSTHKTFKRIK